MAVTPRDQIAHRPARPSRRRVLLRTAVAGVSLVVVLASGIAWSAYQGFAASVPHGDSVPALPAGATDLDGSAQNILLIGSDSRNGATADELKALSTAPDGGSVNTDTTMLLHVPSDASRATIISFPRDGWVDIPDNGKGKLNAAYGDGYAAGKNKGYTEIQAQSSGIRLLIRTISQLTGLHIDHYMQVDLLGFYRISNAIGGVRVCLNQAQNAKTDADAYGSGYSGIDLPAGWSTIEGKQALAFVRQRHGLPNGDLDRIKRQQYFLSAAFSKISSAGTLLNPFELRDLLTAVSSSLLTDPDLDLLALADQFVDLSAGNIQYATVPNVGPQLIHPDGVATSIVGLDAAAMPGFIAGLLGKAADPALAKAVAAAPSSVTVDVLNGTDTAGLAGRNATALRSAGFRVDTVDSAAAASVSLIEYPAGAQAQAKAVAAVVPGAKLTLTSAVKRVTLVLGDNGIEVKGATDSHAGSPVPHAATTGPSTKAAKAAAPSATNCIN
jgi:LCP family protein required for cell wall assembly